MFNIQRDIKSSKGNLVRLVILYLIIISISFIFGGIIANLRVNYTYPLIPILILVLMIICLLLSIVLIHFMKHFNGGPEERDHTNIIDREETNIVTYKDAQSPIEGLMLSFIDRSLISRTKLSNQEYSVLKTNLINGLIRGDIRDPSNIADLIDFLNLQFASNYFAIMLLNIDDCNRFIKSDSEEEWDLVHFIIGNVIRELGNQHGKTYLIQTEKNQLALLINFHLFNANMTVDLMMDIALKAKDIFNNDFLFDITIGIGGIYEGVSYIAESFKDAIMTLSYNRGSKTPICYGDTDLNETFQIYYYPLDIEMRLVNHIRIGEMEKARAILASIYERNFIENNLPNHLTLCLFSDIISTIIKTLNEINVEYADIFEAGLNPISRLLQCQRASEMYEMVLQIYEQICRYINDNQKTRSEELLDEILNYIEKNYNDTNLGVATTAQQFGLNPSYLSQLFKEQTNRNMSEYINDLRLKKAKGLLKDDMLLVNEIAGMVGYGNSARFIRVFKKSEGITPGQYRNSRKI